MTQTTVTDVQATSTLLKLPNETICNILFHVRPSDLENFVQTNRRIQACALPLLAEHRKYIGRYSHLYDGDLLTALAAILRYPHLGHYVREIHNSINDIEIEDEPIIIDFTVLSEAAAASTFIVHEKGMEQCSWDTWVRVTFSEQGKDLWLALLLPLLPNLHTLSIDGWNDESTYRITARALVAMVKRLETPVPNLKRLKLVSDSVRPLLMNYDLGWICPFAQLQLLEELTVDCLLMILNLCDDRNWAKTLLPASLIKLTLHDHSSEWRNHYDLISEALVKDKARLPCLKSLNLLTYSTVCTSKFYRLKSCENL